MWYKSAPYRARAVADPRSVLEEFGTRLPEDVEISIAYDRSGRLYVVDGGFDNVQIFDPEGRLLLVFGSAGRDAGHFNLPVGLFLDSTQTIWVADSYNARVQAFRLLEE